MLELFNREKCSFLIVHILNTAVIVLLVYAIWKFSASKIINTPIFIALVVTKVCFGIFCVFYYESGDIQIFQKDAEALTGLFHSNFQLYKSIVLFDDYTIENARHLFYYWTKPRAFFMAKLLSVFNLLTDSNIYWNSICLSIVNFTCGVYLLSKIKHFLSNYFIASLIAVMLIPTIVFNTSGLEKETITMASIYLIAGVSIQWYFRKFNWIDILLLAIGLFFLYKIKYYYLVPLITLAIALFVYKWEMSRVIKLSVSSILIILVVYFADFIHPYLSLDLAFQSTIQANHTIQMNSHTGKFIPFGFEEYNILEFALNTPLAFISGCFGPFIWQFKNVAMLYVGVENTVLLLLSVYYGYTKFRTRSFSFSLFFLWSFIVMMAIILAFYSPNYGTLMRYKVVFTPLLWILVLQEFIYTSNLKNKLENLFGVNIK